MTTDGKEGQFSFDLEGELAQAPIRDEADLSPGGRTGLDGASALVRSLARISARHPLDRKVIVCRTGGEGRELLRQLALRAGSWVGFEATTTRMLAITVAGPALAARAIRLTDAFDEEGLLDEAIDEVLLEGEEDEHARLARGAGMRRALARAVTTLRLAGVRSRKLAGAPLADPAKARILSRVLAAYEERLRRRDLTDTAGVYGAAASVLRSGEDADRAGAEAGGTGALAGQRVYLAPGIERRGLAGRFLAALQRRGAEVLEADPVRGLAVPASLVWRAAREGAGRLSHLHDVEGAPATIEGDASPDSPDPGATLDIFVANSVEAELREVMRRARERGLGWDEVEIVATDPGVYGSALHALAERMGVPVTFAAGLPVERTRPGRVAAAYFRWIEGGFDAGVVRTLLYAERPHRAPAQRMDPRSHAGPPAAFAAHRVGTRPLPAGHRAGAGGGRRLPRREVRIGRATGAPQAAHPPRAPGIARPADSRARRDAPGLHGLRGGRRPGIAVAGGPRTPPFPGPHIPGDLR